MHPWLLMTNATIFENNSTSNDQIKQNCSFTDKESNNCTANIVQVQNNDCSDNINGSNTNGKDCNATVTTERNQENDTKKNPIVDNDTVLKYVYKKDDKTTNPIKSKGHHKNSIHRRKRSTDDANNSPLPSKIVSPAVIVNYETSHGVPLVEPVHKPPGAISGANLADFSIQTVHDNRKNQKHLENDSSELENDVDKSNRRGEHKRNSAAKNPIPDSEESGENQDYRKLRGENSGNAHVYPQNIKSSSERNDDKNPDESGEYKDQRNRQTSREIVDSGERIEAYTNKQPSHEEDDSIEHVGYTKKQPSRPYDDSGEVKNYKTVKPRGNYYKIDDVQDFNTHAHNNNGERKNLNNRKPSQYGDNSEEEHANNKPSHGHKNSDEHRKNINTSSAEETSDERDDYKNSKPIHGQDRSSERAEHRNSELSSAYDSSSEHGDDINRVPDRESSNSNESRDNRPSSEYNNSEEISKERDLAVENNRNSAESTENRPKNNEKYLSPQYLSAEILDENTKPQKNSAESGEILGTRDRNNYKRNKPDIEKSTEYEHDDSSRETQSLGDVTKNKINFDGRSKSNLESSSSSNSESNEDELIPEDKEQNSANNIKKDLPENGNLISIDPKTAVEILPLTTAIPQLDVNKKPLNTDNNGDSILNPKINRLGSKLIHINDGEVKPVVEINSENDNESSEESNKTSNSDEADSLESILGVKESETLHDDSQSDKLVRQQEVQQGDVKQQFERIPLNYKHDDKNDNKVTEAPKEQKPEVAKDEGTLDVFEPVDVKYDDNLNIKFDDIAIKLPEIKLPDDILSYTLDRFPYSDKKQDKHDSQSYDEPHYYHNHDDKARTRQEKNNDDKDNDDVSGDDNDDEDHKPDSRYYDYYGHEPEKSNYKKKDTESKGEESDENEDLYEKFVRERFGKRGTFEKRSEKLESDALSPQLYDTVKTILKKTADIDKEAKKSGDPNANYMWTLEYGEKL